MAIYARRAGKTDTANEHDMELMVMKTCLASLVPVRKQRDEVRGRLDRAKDRHNNTVSRLKDLSEQEKEIELEIQQLQSCMNELEQMPDEPPMDDQHMASSAQPQAAVAGVGPYGPQPQYAWGFAGAQHPQQQQQQQQQPMNQYVAHQQPPYIQTHLPQFGAAGGQQNVIGQQHQQHQHGQMGQQMGQMDQTNCHQTDQQMMDKKQQMMDQQMKSQQQGQTAPPQQQCQMGPQMHDPGLLQFLRMMDQRQARQEEIMSNLVSWINTASGQQQNHHRQQQAVGFTMAAGETAAPPADSPAPRTPEGKTPVGGCSTPIAMPKTPASPQSFAPAQGTPPAWRSAHKEKLLTPTEPVATPREEHKMEETEMPQAPWPISPTEPWAGGTQEDPYLTAMAPKESVTKIEPKEEPVLVTSQDGDMTDSQQLSDGLDGIEVDGYEGGDGKDDPRSPAAKVLKVGGKGGA
ncbi:unnamed protein product [Prorocentrum cordatum]|uniref:Uncharacterized protein n=1 Tax=Prorocentrum cordatum TaxID=2364126 RepID=A0ABN9QQL5_9DINO|nr:unnamed protein product [Polarella glacialis]